MIYWCELAWLGGDEAVADVELEVAQGRFGAVRTGVALPSPEAVRLRGLTIPGLANAHSHAFHRALRSKTHRTAGSFWSWREAMYRLAGSLQPDSYGRLAQAVFGEMVQAGITAVGEFHYLHHDVGGVRYRQPNVMGEALITAAAAAGIRITLLDTCYLSGSIGEPLGDVQRRFGDDDVVSWAERVELLTESPTARIGAAVHSIRAADPETVAGVAGWARSHAVPLHAHLSEQPAENELCLNAYGKTPAAVFEEAGALGTNFTAVHATHVTPADVDLLGGSGSTVCLCPTTERELADGVGPAGSLVAAGASLAVGTDANAFVDLFEEARAVELDERLVSGVRGTHSGRELLTAATSGGSASIGWADAGGLREGALADFVTIGLDSVRLAGTSRASAVDAAVFSAAAADVSHVVIGGEMMVEDGHHTRFDVAKELRSILEAL